MNDPESKFEMSLRTLRIESQHCYMRNMTDMILNYFHRHCKGNILQNFSESTLFRPQANLKTYEKFNSLEATKIYK